MATNREWLTTPPWAPLSSPSTGQIRLKGESVDTDNGISIAFDIWHPATSSITYLLRLVVARRREERTPGGHNKAKKSDLSNSLRSKEPNE